MHIALHDSVLNLYSRIFFAAKKRNVLLRPALQLLVALIGKRPLNVMLADDDEDDREIFLEAMAQIAPHVNVSVSEDGRRLMNSLYKKDAELPDIIFLDLNMPLKSGHECLREIRSNEAFKSIPVIIYSTSDNKEHIEDSFLHGANFYFPKPGSFPELKTMMRKIFDFQWEDFMNPQKSRFVLSINRLK